MRSRADTYRRSPPPTRGPRLPGPAQPSEPAGVSDAPSAVANPDCGDAPRGRLPGRSQPPGVCVAGRRCLHLRGPRTLEYFQLGIVRGSRGEHLRRPRGGTSAGPIPFRRVSSGGDFTVWLAAAGTVPGLGSPCDSTYSRTVGRNVIIDETRSPSWNATGASLPTTGASLPTTGASLADYRCRPAGAGDATAAHLDAGLPAEPLAHRQRAAAAGRLARSADPHRQPAPAAWRRSSHGCRPPTSGAGRSTRTRLPRSG